MSLPMVVRTAVVLLMAIAVVTTFVNTSNQLEDVTIRLANAQSELSEVYDSYKLEQRRTGDLRAQLEQASAKYDKDITSSREDGTRCGRDLDSKSEELRHAREELQAAKLLHAAAQDKADADARKLRDDLRAAETAKAELAAAKDALNKQVSELRATIEAQRSAASKTDAPTTAPRLASSESAASASAATLTGKTASIRSDSGKAASATDAAAGDKATTTLDKANASAAMESTKNDDFIDGSERDNERAMIDLLGDDNASNGED